ncbi:DUF3099 domain-containing protein [Arthrobacter sp. ERGS1:01]|uniref:DUF3099 domain-containing protein n=1 Tax=Arthrobacter sp. ERGS1:01 TaxID=1704044 RepID=UPI000A541CA7|nr:DUF3099 domain-containing protein [Arthrobacter sp. ERGS1:01]
MKDQSAMPASGTGPRKRYRRAAAVPEVQTITNAAEAHSQEMHGRLVKYATAMGIRMVCIVLIFVFDGWFKLIPVVGAVLLPWVAVVIANAGADTVHVEQASLLDEAPPFELASAPVDPDDDGQVLLQGELVDDDDASPAAMDDDGAPTPGSESGPGGTGPAGHEAHENERRNPGRSGTTEATA